MRNVFLAAIVSLALCSCGGGGGGGDSLNLSLPSGPIKASFFQSDLPAKLALTATVKDGISADIVYVLISDVGGTFEEGEAFIRQAGREKYEVMLEVNKQRHGVHNGTLSVRICADPSCGSVMASANRPYEITVNPPSISDVPDFLNVVILQDSGATDLSLIAKNAGGDDKVFVSVIDPDGRFLSDSTVTLKRYAAGPDAYRVRLPMATGLPAQTLRGNVTLNFCSDASCGDPFLTRSMPYKVQVFTLPFTNSLGLTQELAMDESKNLYVTNYEQIIKIDLDGLATTLFSRKASDDPWPQSLALDSGGNVYFGSLSPPFGIYRMASDGSIRRLSENRANDLAIDKEGNIFGVCSACKAEKKVFKLDSNGSVVSWIPPVQMQAPQGIDITADGIIYIADKSGILKINKDGSGRLLEGEFPHNSKNSSPIDTVTTPSGDLLVGWGKGLYRITDAAPIEVIIPEGAAPLPYREQVHANSIVITSEGKAYINDVFNNLLLFTNLH